MFGLVNNSMILYANVSCRDHLISLMNMDFLYRISHNNDSNRIIQ